MLTKIDTTALHKSFITAEPFHHVVIDDFLTRSALALSKEFPDFHDPLWFVYDNPLERRRHVMNGIDFLETYTLLLPTLTHLSS